MFQENKGLSEVVSYILMIVIAISLAVIVFAWMKLSSNITPLPECPDDVSLMLRNYSCSVVDSKNILSISINNRGFFNVSGFIIKSAPDLNLPPSILLDYADATKVVQQGRYDFIPELAPSESIELSFVYFPPMAKFQIQAFRIQQNSKGIAQVVMCKKNILLQKTPFC